MAADTGRWHRTRRPNQSHAVRVRSHALSLWRRLQRHAIRRGLCFKHRRAQMGDGPDLWVTAGAALEPHRRDGQTQYIQAFDHILMK